MQFEIKNRWSGEVQFTADISDCPEASSYGVKLAFAVKAAVLAGVSLASANLANVDFRPLESANFGSANFESAYFGSAYFGSANFESAYFGSANFESAYFGSANFGSANFGSANFESADFGSADFGSANFGSAYFESANFGSANFGSAYWGDGPKPLAISFRIIDPYQFMAWSDGTIRAGCRTFTPAQYRKHVKDNYPDTPKGKETLRLIASMEAAIKAHKAEEEAAP